MAYKVRERLGGARLKTLRGAAGGNVRGLLAPSKLGAGLSLSGRLVMPKVHMPKASFGSGPAGKYNALRTMVGTFKKGR